MDYEIIPAEKFDLLWIDDFRKYIKKQDKKKIAKDVRKDHGSLLTFKYGKVCKAHVIADDHCAIVCIYGGTYIDKSGEEKRFYTPTNYIFKEAIEVLKTIDTKKL